MGLLEGYYTTDTNLRTPILASPATQTLRSQSGVVNVFASAPNKRFPNASGTPGRELNGLRCRYVRVQFGETVPEGYKPRGVHKVIIYLPSVFNALSDPAAQLEYLGFPVRYVGRTPEYSVPGWGDNL